MHFLEDFIFFVYCWLSRSTVQVLFSFLLVVKSVVVAVVVVVKKSTNLISFTLFNISFIFICLGNAFYYWSIYLYSCYKIHFSLIYLENTHLSSFNKYLYFLHLVILIYLANTLL